MPPEKSGGIFLTDGTNTIHYTYASNDDLTSITHNGFNYGFAYDEYGNTQKVNVGSQNLITNTYEGKNGNLLSAAYGNGQTVGNTYDYYDRVTSRTYNGTALYNWTYDAKGNVGIYTDNVGGYNYRYTYDFANRPSRIDGSNGHSVIYSYDKNSSLNRLVQTLNGSTFKTSYTYNADKLLTQLSMGLGDNLYFNYDGLNRLKNKQFSYGGNTLSTGYTYLGGANGNTSTLVSGYSISKNVGGTDSSLHNYSYAYDKNGNITAISENGTQKAAYQYNELNELIREDNAYINKSVTYSYDVGGNLISKTEYAYTTGALGAPTAVHSYGYGDSNWKDKLTSYDGSAITYDAIGNPLSYIGGWNFTWQQGRKLATAANGQTSISYKYNSDGIRTQKTVNGTATNYYLEGGNISWQTDGTNTIHYTYDSDGDLAYMNLNGNLYYYERNAQNDIIGLVDSNMNEVVTYTYDSWGKLLNIGGSLAGTVGKINPFRYRGYYYDTETGLYYLQSRYYDPGVGRFLNADDEDTLTATPSNLTDKNLYSYCDNNPVMRADDTGKFWEAIAVGAEVGTIGGPAGIIAGILVCVCALAITYIVWQHYGRTLQFSKGGKQNIRDTGFIGVPDEVLARRYADPRTSAKERQRIKKEQKARGDRNKQKRGKKK